MLGRLYVIIKIHPYHFQSVHKLVVEADVVRQNMGFDLLEDGENENLMYNVLFSDKNHITHMLLGEIA